MTIVSTVITPIISKFPGHTRAQEIKRNELNEDLNAKSSHHDNRSGEQVKQGNTRQPTVINKCGGGRVLVHGHQVLRKHGWDGESSGKERKFTTTPRYLLHTHQYKQIGE